MEGMDFIIPQWPVEDLLDRAITHYNRVHWSKRCSLNDAPVLLSNLSLDFLMYDCTEYGTLLGLYPGEDYQQMIHRKVTTAIASAYPNLRAQITAFADGRALHSSQ